MAWTIRDDVPDDRAQVNALALAAFAQYSGDYDDWLAFSAGIGRMADLAADGDLLVAGRDGAIAGAIVHAGPGRRRNGAIYAEDWSVLRTLVVAPRQRGQGTGRALVRAALERARDAGGAGDGAAYESDHGSGVADVSRHRLRARTGLAPIRGVAYALYVLPAEAIPNALTLLDG